ncbi:uncharacterized protein EAE98_002127 [Botrytis deweyae]|uniref:Hydrophobin n=1 Tax=Botrytis deweyae TaxID=2478750 RepID=A0ABQ7IWL8_9HELO|nr:uncharacterized protein EAE98_002127 [Botrytis deweyae]KAF7935907.1 hypothetical protein EAE98_002127 [Botrytis deweyae]
MHASFSAVVTTLLAVSVAALPNNGGGTPTSTWGSTSPTGAPTCSGTKYTCVSKGLLNILTCTNLLNGVGIDIPINILKSRAPEEGVIEARTGSKEGDYCCTTVGLLSLSCINVGNGVDLSIPISIL